MQDNMFFRLLEKVKFVSENDFELIKLNQVENEGLLTLTKNIELISTIIEAVSSNQIENIGNESSFAERVDLLEYKMESANEFDRSYLRTIDFVKNSAKNIAIGRRGFDNLHNMLFKQTSKEHIGGKIALMGNKIEVKDKKTMMVLMTAETAPGERKSEYYNELLSWAGGIKKWGALEKAVFIADFLKIHPYIDGNGRLSRIIHVYLTINHELKSSEIASISQIILANVSLYMRLLRDLGNFKERQESFDVLKPWVSFIRSVDREAYLLGKKYFKEKAKPEKEKDFEQKL